MCGIAGIWGNVSTERLRRMAGALRHRGPDDEGFWTQPDAHIGFGHQRLSIIDVEGGHQPIQNEDGRVVTVFNGEIYNYRELRDELTSAGHRFVTQSDTEVIVHLYEEHGVELVTKLRGMFAIAIWDDANRQLVLIRDRVGKKPLYYCENSDEFLFASEIKGIIAGLKDRPELDRQAIVDYLAWTVIPAPGTIYKRVRSVEPGALLVIRDRKVATCCKYWRMQMQPKSPVSEDEAVDRIDEVLRDAIKLRLRSDVPVGCFLSGGIDSGIITAIAAKEHQGRLTTITVGFEDGSFDERPLARLVAQRYGTDHHDMLIRLDVGNDLPRIAQAYDQPFGDSSAIPTYYVSQAARRHVKVVLSGDGGDELFAGYRRYVAARISASLRWSDGPKRRMLWRMLAGALPVPRGFRSRYAFAHRLIRGMGLNPHERYLAWAVDGVDQRSLRALTAAAERQDWHSDLLPPGRFLDELGIGQSESGPVERMLAADFALILPHDLLVKVDIATMAHGLEARSPLLDHELIETVARFPEQVKLPGTVTKPLLRRLATRYLPSEVCNAPKRGFEVPLVRWLRGELRDLCEDVLLSRNGLLQELFDRSALERLLRGRCRLEPGRWSRRVYLLLMLGVWDQHVYRQTEPTSSLPPADNCA